MALKQLLIQAGIISSLIASIAPATDALEVPEAEQTWQHAILPLTVPAQRRQQQHLRAVTEDCTATVIDTKPVRLLSAWHCFDGYDDLTKSPQVTTAAGPLALRLIASGGSMLADWAVLAPANAHADGILSKGPSLAVAPLQDMPNAAVIMAGFSRVSGDQQRLLRADMNCQANSLDSHWVRSDCTAHKGASGGPVLQHIGAKWRVVGVVSAKETSGARLFTLVPRELISH